MTDTPGRMKKFHSTWQLAMWLVSLDDDDPESAGRKDRQTITLNEIITHAREALEYERR